MPTCLRLIIPLSRRQSENVRRMLYTQCFSLFLCEWSRNCICRDALHEKGTDAPRRTNERHPSKLEPAIPICIIPGEVRQRFGAGTFGTGAFGARAFGTGERGNVTFSTRTLGTWTLGTGERGNITFSTRTFGTWTCGASYIPPPLTHPHTSPPTPLPPPRPNEKNTRKSWSLQF